jgi:hypothetical protein
VRTGVTLALGELARVWQSGYTESEAGETVADVARDLFANRRVAGTLLDSTAASQLARI